MERRSVNDLRVAPVLMLLLDAVLCCTQQQPTQLSLMLIDDAMMLLTTLSGRAPREVGRLPTFLSYIIIITTHSLHFLGSYDELLERLW